MELCSTFQFFQCSDDVAGKKLLKADFQIVCWEEQHLKMVAFTAVPALFLYVLGIPAILFFFLWYNRERLDEDLVRMRLGFLYSNYTKKGYAWEIVVFLRSVIARDARLSSGTHRPCNLGAEACCLCRPHCSL